MKLISPLWNKQSVY